MPVQNDRINKLWETFKLACIHQSVPEPMVLSLKMAFFGGASSVFFELIKMLTPGTEASEEDIQNMRNIEKELRTFTGVHGVIN